MQISCEKDQENHYKLTEVGTTTNTRTVLFDSLYPLSAHFDSMSADLKKLKHNDPLLAELIRMKKNGCDVSVSNSIVLNGNSLTKFAIFTPIFKNSVCDYVLAYERCNGQFLFYIITETYVKNLILNPNTGTDSEKNKLNIMASGLNAIHFIIHEEIDSILNNFVISNSVDSLNNRIVNDRACVYYFFMVPTIIHLGSDIDNHEGFITLTQTTFIWCDEIVLPNVTYSIDPYEPRILDSGGAPSTDVPPSTMIDLDCWRNGLTASVKSKIYEILESYFDPCDSESISNIINNILIEACTERSENSPGSDNSFLETLEDAVFGQGILDRISTQLEGVDKIIFDPSYEKCKNLKCVFEYLELSGSKLFCNNVYKFVTSDVIDLTVKVENIPGYDGSTTMSSNGTGVIITYDDFFCNSTDFLYIAETILHESQHAAFKFNLASHTDTQAEYKAKFLKWVNEKYGVEYTEDRLMILTYMEKSAEELWILNGKKFDKSYYMAWVWDGLSGYWPNKFPESKIQEWNAKRELINQNNPFQCR